MKRIIFCLTLILVSNVLISQSNKDIEIIEKPIEYNKERIRLSVEYLKERHGIIQDKPTIIPKVIVLHYTAGGTI
jgi:N-acetylmuramoyl-L-alanine amidase